MVRRSSNDSLQRIEHIRDRITLHQGDFLVQNGGMHEWENRSSKQCVAAFVIFTTGREE